MGDIVLDALEALRELEKRLGRDDIVVQFRCSTDVWRETLKETALYAPATPNIDHTLFGIRIQEDPSLPECSLIGYNGRGEIALFVYNGKSVDIEAMRKVLGC